MNRLVVSIILVIVSFQTMSAELRHEDKSTPARLNQYVADLLLLHKLLIADKDIRIEKRTGGYGGATNDLEFYTEEKFYNASSGELISSIKKEKKNPENVHMIDVFVYDSDGRMSREYSASYLPVHRRSPHETRIIIHGFHNGLHSQREYDASGNRLSELCIGKHKNAPVHILYEEFEIPDHRDEIDGNMAQQIYIACFRTIPGTIGSYINPLYGFR